MNHLCVITRQKVNYKLLETKETTPQCGRTHIVVTLSTLSLCLLWQFNWWTSSHFAIKDVDFGRLLFANIQHNVRSIVYYTTNHVRTTSQLITHVVLPRVKVEGVGGYGWAVRSHEHINQKERNRKDKLYTLIENEFINNLRNYCGF